MKLAVTGGAGFIGSAVRAVAAEAGHSVVSVDRQGMGVDVRSRRLAEHFEGVETVIHLAGVLGTAELFDTPRQALDINVFGTLSVLEACQKVGAGFVGITMPDAFPSVYTASKIAAQRLATAWHHAYGLPVAHVRAFNAYGVGQKHGPHHPRKIIPAFSTAAWRREPMEVWGDGTQTVDLVHVDDLARMLVDACAFGDDSVFDGGTGQALSVRDVAGIVAGIVGPPCRMVFAPMRRGEIPTNVVATGEGWDRLGWQPRFDLDALTRTVESYRP